MFYVLNVHEKVNSKEWVGLQASPGGPIFSHLFFADDLVLFANADDKSCNTVLEVLNEFCCVSGQRVNFNKSKFFCSPNLPRTALRFSFKCGATIYGFGYLSWGSPYSCEV